MAFTWTDSAPIQGGKILKSQFLDVKNTLDGRISTIGATAYTWSYNWTTEFDVIRVNEVHDLFDGYDYAEENRGCPTYQGSYDGTHLVGHCSGYNSPTYSTNDSTYHASHDGDHNTNEHSNHQGADDDVNDSPNYNSNETAYLGVNKDPHDGTHNDPNNVILTCSTNHDGDNSGHDSSHNYYDDAPYNQTDLGGHDANYDSSNNNGHDSVYRSTYNTPTTCTENYTSHVSGDCTYNNSPVHSGNIA